MNKIKYLDTFAGIGGFHLALQKSIGKDNIKCIGYSEIDKYAKKVYSNHFNSQDLGDITKINIDKLEDFDLLTGGFPCTDISSAGLQDLTKGRTILVSYLIDILKVKQPKYFIFENVETLLSDKFADFYEYIIKSIKDIGYNIETIKLNTKDFGLPQNRKRIFIIGSLEKLPNFNKIKTKKKILLKDFLEQNVDKKYYMINEKIELVKKSNYTSRQPKNVEKDIIGTLTVGGDKKRIYYGEYNDNEWRYLTENELERLQGYPEGWCSNFVSNTQVKKQTGNSITVNVVVEILNLLIK